MAEHKIEFRRVRDFGENLGDIFQYLRQEGKSFFRAFFAICGLFMLLTAVLTGFFNARVFSGILNPETLGRTNPFASLFSATYVVTLLSSLFTHSSMHTAVFCYVKAYIDNGNTSPDIEQVWKLFLKNFFKVFLSFIPVGILMIIGFILCIVPGVYLSIAFAPIAMILIYEDTGFGTAFSRCTYLLKNNFWASFGIYAVAGLIYYIAQTLIGGAITAVAGLVAYLSTKDIQSVVGVITSFFSAFSYCFYVILLLGIAFNYFTLAEDKDGLGILNRINSIGQKKPNNNAGEEEY